MYIVHAASEIAPIAKVGGLGDVVYSFAKATAALGHRVEVIVPKYDSIQYDGLKELRPEYRDLWVYDGPYQYHNTVWSAKVEEAALLLMQPDHPSYYFNRGQIYGAVDDIDRFIYFSRAVCEYLYKSGKRPDILHIHDWPTALIAPLYREMYTRLGMKIGGVVLTIHNLEHQGKCSPFNLTKAGLRGEDYLSPNQMQDPENPALINLLKGGIEYADFITTVSPTYEKEAQTPEGGFGLDTLLLQHKKKFCGILNGIDCDYWNPATDRHLSYPYASVKGKAKSKIELRHRFELVDRQAPIVCAISRLVPQKGPLLIEAALEHTLDKGGQFILLGSSPIAEIRARFEALEKKLSHNKNVAFFLDYDEALSHLVYAGSDMIVIPSIFEPCGLTQMIALRYGTVPIVRKTGGLADTVSVKNGFIFAKPEKTALFGALDEALTLFSKDRNKWDSLAQAGMALDFSWNKSMNDYLQTYGQVCGASLPKRKKASIH